MANVTRYTKDRDGNWSQVAADYEHPIPCKVCDRGALVRMTKYRLGVPVVVIGYIFLIPCVLGMFFSSIVLLGVLVFGATASANFRNDSIIKMRRAGVPEMIIESVLSKSGLQEVESWKNDLQERYRVVSSQRQAITDARIHGDQAIAATESAVPRMRYAGIPDSVIIALAGGRFEDAEQWLILATPIQAQAFREFEDQRRSAMSSYDKAVLLARSLKVPDAVISDLVRNAGKTTEWLAETETAQLMNARQRQAVHDATEEMDGIPWLAAFAALGSGFAISLGVASFVGGLLGWLLVMRKRILKCSTCGAVINAS
jgi:hypothetical protein